MHIAPFEDWDAERDRIVAQLGGYVIERLACNHCTGMTAVQKMLEAGLPVYWHVKDHCKRTGKQCLFVENTGTASLKRALLELLPANVA